MDSYIVLDFETTGLEPRKDVVIEAAAIKVERRGVVEEMNTLVNPGRAIPPVARSVTGITDEMVVDAPGSGEVFAQLKELAGDLPIVGHNVEFDRDFLRAAGADLSGPTIDTFFLSQVLLPGATSQALGSLSKLLGNGHDNAHRAMGDVLANKELLESLEKLAAGLGSEVKDKMVDVARKGGMDQYADWLQQLENNSEKLEISGKILSEIPEIKGETVERLNILHGDKVLIEGADIQETDWVQWLGQQDEKAVLVPKDFGYLKELFGDNDEVDFWEEGHFLLDEQKWSEFLNQDKFTTDEARVAWKILASDSNHRSDVRIGGFDEFRVWERLAQTDYEHGESEAKVLIVSGKAFWNEDGWGEGREQLVITDGTVLLDVYDAAHKVSLHDGFLANTPMADVVQKFFQDAGQFFQKTEEGKFATMFQLNEEFWKDPMHQPLRGIFGDFIKEISDHDSELAGKLEIFINDEAGWVRSVWVWPDGKLVFNAVPVLARDEFLEKIGQFEKVLIGLPTREGESILRVLGGLNQDEWDLEKIEKRQWQNAQFWLHHSDTEKKDDAFVVKGLMAGVESWMASDEERLLILCNSVHMVEKNFLAIEGMLEKEGIVLLGEGMSGGKKRILSELEDERRVVLLCRHEFLPEKELHDSRWRTMILTKVAFDPPKQPLLEERGKFFDNSFEQMTIPRVALRLVRSIPVNVQKIVCLDHNLGRPWAEKIVNAIGVRVEWKKTDEIRGQ